MLSLCCSEQVPSLCGIYHKYLVMNHRTVNAYTKQRMSNYQQLIQSYWIIHGSWCTFGSCLFGESGTPTHGILFSLKSSQGVLFSQIIFLLSITEMSNMVWIVTDFWVVRAGVSVTWNVLSWSGSHEFEPHLGWTWGMYSASVLSRTWTKNMNSSCIKDSFM